VTAVSGDAARPPVRVAIAEDHAVVAEALATMFSLVDDVQVVGQVSSGEDAVALAERLRPDIFLMDVGLKGLNGLEATRQITRRTPSVRVLVLTMHDDVMTVARAVAAGAAGFVPKNAKREDLFRAVESVASGGGFLHQHVTSDFLSAVAPLVESSLSAERLTDRELEVLRNLSYGRSTKEIAHALVVSDETVKSHLTHIYQKLGVGDRTAAVAVALRRGLVS
jgi:DNA-binding NarL/FixJ family response regulator